MYENMSAVHFLVFQAEKKVKTRFFGDFLKINF